MTGSDRKTGLSTKIMMAIIGGTYGGINRRSDEPNRKLRRDKMTVCIAMIANTTKEGSSTIVFAADREVSHPAVKFEGGFPKIEFLHVHAYIMASSNDALESDDIILKTKQRISNKECTVRDIVDILSEEVKLKYDNELEEKRKLIFTRYHVTPKEFKSKAKSKLISDEVKIDLIDGLNKTEYEFRMNCPDTNFLVVGIDTAPHIWVVDQLGNKKTRYRKGFAAIGTGNTLAYAEITRLLHYTTYE
ncbi:MAG: hypothetical protein WC620_11675 [Methanoregula sp.]|jgi:hypothetical protein